MLARLYVLLGKHPEYLTADAGERIDRALDRAIPLSGLDVTLLAAATEIDRLCAHTVMVLRGQASKPLLDALGVTDPDRIVAMYYALPDKRREIVKQDPAWAFHISNAPDGLEQVMAETDSWIAESERREADQARLHATVPAAVSGRLKRLERLMLYREAGLAVDITPAERADIEESERIGARLLKNVGFIAEELTALKNPHDEQAQGRAIRRAMRRMR